MTRHAEMAPWEADEETDTPSPVLALMFGIPAFGIVMLLLGVVLATSVLR